MTEGVFLGPIILLLTLLVLLSAFFAGSEVALVSQQRVRLRRRASEGSAAARHIEGLLDRPGRLLSTLLLGVNLVQVAAASLSTAIGIVFLGPERGILAATVGVTAVLLIFGELLPKTLAAHYPDPVAHVIVYPVRFVAFLFGPVVYVLSRLAEWVAALFGERRPRGVTEEEVRTMTAIGLAEGSVEPEEAAMVSRVFRLGSRPVREIMTPRPDIVWVREGTTFAELLPIYLATPHSRFPVYRGTFDQVVGVLSIRDVLQARAQGRVVEASPLTARLRPPLFVPETKTLGPLLGEMRSASSPMALVVDEYGSIAGLVTLDRLVAEVVGVQGNDLTEPEPVAASDEAAFHVDGGTSIDDANARFALGLPHGDYQTVAGFLLSRLDHIPQEGEQVFLGSHLLTVDRMRGARIDRVLVARQA